MGKIHRQYSPSFEAKVSLEAIKEEKTVNELISRLGGLCPASGICCRENNIRALSIGPREVYISSTAREIN